MKVLISSTIRPGESPTYDGQRSLIDPSIRLEQTQKTISSVRRLGFSDIVVIDNSPGTPETHAALALLDAETLHLESFQFLNRGISEAFALLTALARISTSEPILKISGRYELAYLARFDLDTHDVSVKFNGSVISTRCYAVRTQETMASLLTSALNTCYRWPTSVVGPRSFFERIRDVVRPDLDRKIYFDPTISIEFGLTRAISEAGIRVQRLEQLGVTGKIRGVEDLRE